MTPSPVSRDDIDSGSADQRRRVVIADHQRLIRDGVKYSLAKDSKPRYEVVAELADTTETIGAVGRLRPDLLIIEIERPERSDPDVIRACLRLHPHLAVVVLTMQADPSVVRKAIALGALGYVLKDADPKELLLALRLALRGASYLAPGLAAAVANPGDADAADVLDDREREVVRLLALGHSYPQIAQMMRFSERTVKNYRARAVEALGISTRPELTQWALAHGLIGERRVA